MKDHLKKIHNIIPFPSRETKPAHHAPPSNVVALDDYRTNAGGEADGLVLCPSELEMFAPPAIIESKYTLSHPGGPGCHLPGLNWRQGWKFSLANELDGWIVRDEAGDECPLDEIAMAFRHEGGEV